MLWSLATDLQAIFNFEHNKAMINNYFITDLTVEAAEKLGFSDIAKTKKLSYGIEQNFINIKNLDTAKKLQRERGVYITYDCGGEIFENNRACAALERYLSNSIIELSGVLRKKSPVFVVGLGNGEIVADSLGSLTVSKIAVNRQLEEVGRLEGQSVCALAAGVYGATGIQSLEVVKALCGEINPSLVILVDSFATSSVARLGQSFQLSTAGITPGSGVGQDKERIDKSVLGVNVISLGVPLLLSLRTVIGGFVNKFIEETGCEKNEFKLRSMLVENKLSSLVVAPKNIKFLAELSSGVIANAINKAFYA